MDRNLSIKIAASNPDMILILKILIYNKHIILLIISNIKCLYVIVFGTKLFDGFFFLPCNVFDM